MSYEFEIDRDNGEWTAYNPSGTEIANGELPLTNQQRKLAILDDKGVSNPVRDALTAIITEDWDDIGDVHEQS